jgi:hypothetical protein
VNTIIILQGWVALAISLVMLFCASRMTIEERVLEMKAGRKV